MKEFPGCPKCRVKHINYVPHGAFLKLQCGHWLWEAGFNETGQFIYRSCQGGCYVPQRYMGDYDE